MDEFACYKDEIVLFYYVVNGIFIGLYSKAIARAIKEIERAELDISYKGNIGDYLGVNVEDQDNKNIKLTQTQIIDIIINDIQLPKNTTP